MPMSFEMDLSIRRKDNITILEGRIRITEGRRQKNARSGTV